MILLDVLYHLLSAAITIVLAFSPGIAHFAGYTSDRIRNAAEVVLIPKETPLVPSLFESFNEIIRRQLHTDQRYQQAAVAGAFATSSPVSATSVEKALVNIFCTARGKDSVRTVTGSGVFIDQRGVILTNAHIAQFLLLTEETARTQARCVVRQGNPAKEKYEVGLLYVSPVWIITNAQQFYAPTPSGTGEYDFALLYVTGAIEGDLPEVFPSLRPALMVPLLNPMDVRAAGYPAEILTTDNTRAPLVPITATTSVTQLFTFGSGKVDLVAIAPSTVGQQGSSGGPIVDVEGDVIGLIVTRGNTLEEGAQSLRALTLSYVDRTLREETGLDLSHTLAGDITLRANVFQETVAPYLQKLLLGTR